MPGPTPSPQPGPTPTPDVSHVALPEVPPNTYELLSSLADAIDTANGQFTTHAGKLAGISQQANGAVGNVTSTSTGYAATALADTWTSTQTDFNHAHDPLSGIIASTCMGGSPNPLWESLDQNKSAIQNGLVAMENIQVLQRSCPLHPPSAQQVEEWIQQVNALTASLGNVNLTLQVMIIALRNLNGGFAATCATGFTPGAPLPTFPKNAFAASSTGTGGGGGKLTPDQLSDYLKGKGVDPGVADELALWADENGLNLDNVKSLLDSGADPKTVIQWIESGKLTSANLNDVISLTGRGISSEAMTQLLNSGADLGATSTSITSLLRRPGVTASNINGWIQKGLNLKYADILLSKGATVSDIDGMIGDYTSSVKGSTNWNKLPKSNVVQVLNRWKTGSYLTDASGNRIGNDGTTFNNNPQPSSKGGVDTPFPNPKGTITEYYVNYPGGDRILVDESGKAYYYPSTSGHYDPGTRIPIPFSYIMQVLGK